MGVKRGERDRQRIASQDSNMGHHVAPYVTALTTRDLQTQ